MTEASPLDKHLWEMRILIVSTPSLKDPRYLRQMAEFRSSPSDMQQRYLTVIECVGNAQVRVDGKESKEWNCAELRSTYGISGSGFQTLLIGYDGGVKLQETEPILAHVLFDTIDGMPIRQMEMGFQGKYPKKHALP